MADTLGISIRMIRAYDETLDRTPRLTMEDKALFLAMADTRAISTGEKIRDAMTFLKSRIH